MTGENGFSIAATNEHIKITNLTNDGATRLAVTFQRLEASVYLRGSTFGIIFTRISNPETILAMFEAQAELIAAAQLQGKRWGKAHA